MYAYRVYHAMSSTIKQLQRGLAETNVVLIVFNGIFYNVRAYTVTVPYRRSTCIMYH